MINVYLIDGIDTLVYAINILTHESISIMSGIQSVKTAKIHDLLIIMIR